MSNTALNKWLELYNWQKQHRKLNRLNAGADPKKLERIEQMIQEKLPESFKTLYLAHDGENEDGDGEPVLFNHGFVGTSEIIRQLEFSVGLLKPTNRSLTHPEQSRKMEKQIADFFAEAAGKRKWEKINFTIGPGSLGGPYIYQKSDGDEYDILNIKNTDGIMSVTRELHELEKENYNWDDLEFNVYKDGKYEVKRTDYDFNNEIDFTSYPEGAIKKIYFHYKWVPLFKDHSGNFIGLDFDPDVNGKKGQVIVFGRDEENMIVVADDLESFFDFFLEHIKNHESNVNGLPFFEESHLHDVLKNMIITEE